MGWEGSGVNTVRGCGCIFLFGFCFRSLTQCDMALYPNFWEETWV